MPINNVTFSQLEIVGYSKMNQLSADATNNTDNIHPQYVLATAAGVTDGFFVLKAGDTMTGTLEVPKLKVGNSISLEGQTTISPSFIAGDGKTSTIITFEGNTPFIKYNADFSLVLDMINDSGVSQGHIGFNGKEIFNTGNEMLIDSNNHVKVQGMSIFNTYFTLVDQFTSTERRIYVSNGAFVII